MIKTTMATPGRDAATRRKETEFIENKTIIRRGENQGKILLDQYGGDDV